MPIIVFFIPIIFFVIFFVIAIFSAKTAQKRKDIMENKIKNLFSQDIPNMSKDEQEAKKLKVIKCPNCGAQMELQADGKWHCKYCKTKAN